MDPTAFDALARSFAKTGTRRWLVRLVASLSLGGVLTTSGSDEAAAERPIDRIQRRTPQRNRQQRNNNNQNTNRNKNNRNNKKNNKNGGKLGGAACSPTGNLCTQDSDCCSSNCFNTVCAERVTQCSHSSTTRQCVPAAKGCAGGSCCYGAAACGTTCCDLPANQCNPSGACCAPNCDGRECGPDGCGAGGTCGPGCQRSQTCTATGQCQGTATCAQNCPNGCCDAAGNCQPGNTIQACGTGGASCQACPSAPAGETATCANGVCGATCNNNTSPCQGGCCPSGQHCFPDGCCTAIYDPCTADSQCCSFPRSTCKTVGGGARRFCCGVSRVSPCQSNEDCCSGTCQQLTCA